MKLLYIYLTVLGLIIVFTVFTQGDVQAQHRYFNQPTQANWIVGIEYSPFNLDLGAPNLFKGGLSSKFHKKVKQNQFLSSYYGIHMHKRIWNQLFISSGLGYSNQYFHFQSGSGSITKLYHERNLIHLNYVHLPLSLNFRQEMGFDKKVGVNINLGLLMSYSCHYRIENNLGKFVLNDDREYTDEWYIVGGNYFDDGEQTVFAKNGPEDESRDFEKIRNYPYDEFVRRFLIGGIAEAEVFFVIVDRIQIAPGIWYNRDFLTTGSSKNKGLAMWNYWDQVKFYNTRWGVKLKLGYIIE